jgi:hypothetical protein
LVFVECGSLTFDQLPQLVLHDDRLGYLVIRSNRGHELLEGAVEEFKLLAAE